MRERVYHANVVGSHLRAEEVTRRVASNFPVLAAGVLTEVCGEEMTFKFPLMAPLRVRFVHRDGKSLMLQAGRPENGRISFACERDGKVLRLRLASHAAGVSWIERWGYILGGRAMQHHVWRDFLLRAAELAGGRLDGPVTDS